MEHRTLAHRARVLAGALIAMAMFACGGPDLKKICKETEACRGGNERDVEACVEVAEAERNLTDDIGCGDEHDTYYECYEKYATCRDTAAGGQCMTTQDCGGGGAGFQCVSGQCVRRDYGLEADVCRAEENAYESCSNIF